MIDSDVGLGGRRLTCNPNPTPPVAMQLGADQLPSGNLAVTTPEPAFPDQTKPYRRERGYDSREQMGFVKASEVEIEEKEAVVRNVVERNESLISERMQE